MCGRHISNGYIWCVPCVVQKNWNGPCRGGAGKRESQRYHEWQQRSQQRAQCAPAAATNTPFLAKSDSKIKTSIDLHVQAIRPDLQACYIDQSTLFLSILVTIYTDGAQ